jgi:cytochrome c553
MRVAVAAVVSVVFGVAAGCKPTLDRDPLSHLPRHEEQLAVLCARGVDDAVTRAFCGPDAPVIDSLAALQRALDVHPTEGASRTGFALTGHSTALFGRSVSAANPRAIFTKLPEQRADGEIVTLGCSRGEQVVEIGVMPPGGAPSFYLVRYEQACNDDVADDGANACTVADTVSARTESGWTNTSVYEDIDLENSVFDCLHCHRPDGPGTPRIFRMQELRNPWTHWFSGVFGRALVDEYRLVHGDAGFANIPGPLITASNPIVVQNVIERSLSQQTNLFPSPIIEEEVTSSAPGQPFDHRRCGSSETWDGLFEEAVAGRAIPVPFHNMKVTDPERIVDVANAWRAFVDDSSREPPDLRDVMRDDALFGSSARARPGASAPEILVQMCAQCHNDRVDPSLSLSRFNAFNLNGLDASEREGLIARLRLPKEDRYKMPPPFMRSLTDAEIDAIEAFLRR